MGLFSKVAIVGLGLIGGSLAGAIKKKRLSDEIIGVSRQRKTIWLAKKNRLIDRGSQDIRIIKDADLVVLATPVGTILSLAPKIAKFIKKDCLVTDVGSTKQEISSKLARLFPKYVGSHPLSGSEKRGLVNASGNIFQDSLCILTPLKNTDKGAKKKIKRLWNEIGARVVYLSPSTHDKILSLVSHLPHLLAFSLISTVPRKYLPFASSGLKDTTRIAASDSRLWGDIFLSNRKNMLKALGLFQENLSQIRAAIIHQDKEVLSLMLKAAKAKRERLV